MFNGHVHVYMCKLVSMCVGLFPYCSSKQENSDHVYMCAFAWVCVFAHVHVCKQVHGYMCVCVHVCVHVFNSISAFLRKK